jgi:serine protease Do
MNIIKAVACLVVVSGTMATAAVLAPAGERNSETSVQATTARRSRPAVVFPGGGSRLGISIRDVGDEDLETARLSSPGGVVVEEVSEGSAAEDGGLRKGDIIVEFDGERVRSVRQLTRLVQETADGRKVPTAVMRDGQRVSLTVAPRAGRGAVFGNFDNLVDMARDFSVEIPARPVTPPTASPRARTTPPSVWRFEDLLSRGASRLGITVDTLSPQLAEYFGTKEGVLVTSVQDDSAAARTGVRAGDVITSVNGAGVDDPAQLRRRLQALNAGEEFTIGIVRDKKPQTLKGKLDDTARRRTYRSIV